MSKILLTGATGYIGNKLVKGLLETRQDQLLIPVRAAKGEEFKSRVEKMKSSFSTELWPRLEFIQSDLDELIGKLESEKKNISMIIHNAAKTAFNVDESTANSVNRDASVKLLNFSRECLSLESFVYVSTLYASGMIAGEIKEEFFKKPNFANHYERSKWEVEENLRTQFQDIPWKIARVATVISDGLEGKVIQQNAIHNTLKLFYYGLISLLPGRPDTPIHLVDGEFVKDSLVKIINHGEKHGIYNVCYDQNGSIQLGRFIDVAFEEFNKDEGFKSRRLLKPLFTDEKSFDTLVTNVKGFGGTVLNQGLSSISPFGRQLFIKKEVKNNNLLNLISDYKTPPMETIIRNTCQYLVATKFAKDAGGTK